MKTDEDFFPETDIGGWFFMALLAICVVGGVLN